MRFVSVVTVCALSVAPLLAAQPLGNEFRVNAFTTGSQYAPRVAVAPGGPFLVVWSDRPSMAVPSTLRGRVFDAFGNPGAGDFEVAAYTSAAYGDYPPLRPAASAIGPGAYIVAWDVYDTESGYSDVHARRFDVAGGALGPEFVVNTNTVTHQYQATVAGQPDGSFVVAWTGADGESEGIWARRFDAAGEPLGENFRVNTYTTGTQWAPAIAIERPSADFLIVWESDGQDGGGAGVYGQRFLSTGEPSGAEFRVNTSTTGDQYLPAVSAWEAGFVVVWNTKATDGIAGQRFSNLDWPAGLEFEVASNIGFHPGASVACDHHGDFAVAWTRVGYPYPDNTGSLVFARRYSVTGAPLGTPFRVNGHTTSNNAYPSVSANIGSGSFVVAWQTYRYGAASRHDVFAQRYLQIAGYGDASGDGKTDVLDVFYLINVLFAGGAPPIGPSDVNGDGAIDVLDVFYLINYLFAGGPAPN